MPLFFDCSIMNFIKFIQSSLCCVLLFFNPKCISVNVIILSNNATFFFSFYHFDFHFYLTCKTWIKSINFYSYVLIFYEYIERIPGHFVPQPQIIIGKITMIITKIIIPHIYVSGVGLIFLIDILYSFDNQSNLCQDSCRCDFVLVSQSIVRRI